MGANSFSLWNWRAVMWLVHASLFIFSLLQPLITQFTLGSDIVCENFEKLQKYVDIGSGNNVEKEMEGLFLTESSCCRLCHQHDGCVAFVFMKQGHLLTLKNLCSLKNVTGPQIQFTQMENETYMQSYIIETVTGHKGNLMRATNTVSTTSITENSSSKRSKTNYENGKTNAVDAEERFPIWALVCILIILITQVFICLYLAFYTETGRTLSGLSSSVDIDNNTSSASASASST